MAWALPPSEDLGTGGGGLGTHPYPFCGNGLASQGESSPHQAEVFHRQTSRDWFRKGFGRARRIPSPSSHRLLPDPLEAVAFHCQAEGPLLELALAARHRPAPNGRWQTLAARTAVVPRHAD